MKLNGVNVLTRAHFGSLLGILLIIFNQVIVYEYKKSNKPLIYP